MAQEFASNYSLNWGASAIGNAFVKLGLLRFVAQLQQD
jgi:hypothetical protein